MENASCLLIIKKIIKKKTVCHPWTRLGVGQKTDNLRAYVVILDLEYMHICDRQSITLCARQISVYEVLCPTLCLYGCIFFVYYVCITWPCIFVYVCYPLLERVYWYVVLLCYICYTELKKKKKKKKSWGWGTNMYVPSKGSQMYLIMYLYRLERYIALKDWDKMIDPMEIETRRWLTL